MEKTYAEKTSENEIAIHCDVQTAELLYEGICKIFAEYRRNYTEKERIEKRNLVKLKKEIEILLPK